MSIIEPVGEMDRRKCKEMDEDGKKKDYCR